MDFGKGMEEGIYRAQLQQLTTLVETMNAQMDQLSILEEKAQDELNDEAEKPNRDQAKVEELEQRYFECKEKQQEVSSVINDYYQRINDLQQKLKVFKQKGKQ